LAVRAENETVKRDVIVKLAFNAIDDDGVKADARDLADMGFSFKIGTDDPIWRRFRRSG